MNVLTQRKVNCHHPSLKSQLEVRGKNFQPSRTVSKGQPWEIEGGEVEAEMDFKSLGSIRSQRVRQVLMPEQQHLFIYISIHIPPFPSGLRVVTT